jgi:hypothetical protein
MNCPICEEVEKALENHRVAIHIAPNGSEEEQRMSTVDSVQCLIHELSAETELARDRAHIIERLRDENDGLQRIFAALHSAVLSMHKDALRALEAGRDMCNAVFDAAPAFATGLTDGARWRDLRKQVDRIDPESFLTLSDDEVLARVVQRIHADYEEHR